MKTQVILVAAFLSLCLGLGSLQAASAECYAEVEISRDMMEGAALSRAEISELEGSIKKAPSDVHLRVRAAGYYLYGEQLSAENSHKYADHVLWLIDICPSSYSVGNFTTYLDARHMPEAYAKARGVWLEKLETQSNNIQIHENAVKFFMLEDVVLAEKYLGLGLEIDPSNERLLRYQRMLAE